MTEVDAFLANCRLADGRLIDIGISGGRIAVVGEGAASRSNSAPAQDIGGDLVLPGLVDGHMHLDKTLTGLPWMGHAARCRAGRGCRRQGPRTPRNSADHRSR